MGEAGGLGSRNPRPWFPGTIHAQSLGDDRFPRTTPPVPAISRREPFKRRHDSRAIQPFSLPPHQFPCFQAVVPCPPQESPPRMTLPDLQATVALRPGHVIAPRHCSPDDHEAQRQVITPPGGPPENPGGMFHDGAVRGLISDIISRAVGRGPSPAAASWRAMI